MTYESPLWTTTRGLCLFVAALCTSLPLAGCNGGGGSEDNVLREPMPLDGHDNAVRALAATILTASFAGLDGPWERPTSADGESGTEDCSGGGSVTYDEPRQKTEFSSCDQDARADVEILVDGTIDERCASGADGRECVRIGDPDVDQLFVLLSDDDELVSATIELEVARRMQGADMFDDVVNGNFVISRDETPTSGYGDFELSDLRIVQSFNEGDQRTTAQIGGRYKASSYDDFNCATGGVSIETLEPIIYDGAVVGGELRLDNGAGDAITARFSEDGTVSIVGTDGSSDSATYAEIDAFCDELSLTQSSENPPNPDPEEPCTLTIGGICVM